MANCAGIDPEALGVSSGPVRVSWTETDTMLYALGVGATNHDLAYTTENSNGVALRALPTLAVVLGWDHFAYLDHIGDFDRTKVVHGEQRLTIFKEVPPAATITLESTIVEIEDKGSGALVGVETVATDETDGRPMFHRYKSNFIRGAGGWGRRATSAAPPFAYPDRSPDLTVSSQTSPDQALLYRLSGDRHPLHSDPTFAKEAGFQCPILHGLCTFGVAGRALLQAVADDDPARFVHMEGRFSAPVYPGDELSTDIWLESEGALFRVRTADGVVLDRGRFSVG